MSNVYVHIGAPPPSEAPTMVTGPSETESVLTTEVPPPEEPEGMAASTEEAASYDPGEHTIDEVKEYVEANPDQVTAVLDAEATGKNRSTLITWLEEQEASPEESP